MNEKKPIEVVDRRNLKRLNVRYIGHVYLDEKILCSTVININEKGVGIMIPKIIPEEQVLDIRMECHIKNDEKKDIQLKTQLVWMSQKNENGMYRAGLEITEISEKDLKILKEHIQYLCDKEEEQK